MFKLDWLRDAGFFVLFTAIGVFAASCMAPIQTTGSRSGGNVQNQPHPGWPGSSGNTRRAMAGTQHPSVPKPSPPVTHSPNPEDSMYFRYYGVNPTIDTEEDNVSTFSADVDTASYQITKAFLQRGRMPMEASIRVEEFVNSFDYHYQSPKQDTFALYAEVFPSPNRKGYHVLHLGVQAKKIQAKHRRPANLVFVVDVSGSMRGKRRLGLLKKSLALLVKNLNEKDQVSIVAFNSKARLVLQATPGNQKQMILNALNQLEAGGNTNAGAGLLLGYEVANQAYREGQINRVILVSDGVANTGVTRAKGIFATIDAGVAKHIQLLSVGIGMGNYNDTLLEKLAVRGQGHYTYINSYAQARHFFGKKLTSILVSVAKDVKLQVKFNPKVVSRFRLIGYENRMLKRRDFKNDKKDAAEIGAGHSVTALYEIKLRAPAQQKRNQYFGQFAVRYKDVRTNQVREMSKRLPVSVVRSSFQSASAPTRLSLVVAGFAEKLRGSYWVRNLSYAKLTRLYQSLPLSLRRQANVAQLGRLIGAASRLDTRHDKFERKNPKRQMDFDRVPRLR